MGQYPTPPPVATGPGLDRPLGDVSPSSGVQPSPLQQQPSYTMARTRKFYQDQMDDNEPTAAAVGSARYG